MTNKMLRQHEAFSTNHHIFLAVKCPFRDLPYECVIRGGSGRHIIETKEQMHQFSECNIPGFDFNTNSIIVRRGSSSGHFTPIVDVLITKDDQRKKYIIDVDLSGGKHCTCRVMKPGYQRIIYVKKLDDDYEIEFR